MSSERSVTLQRPLSSAQNELPGESQRGGSFSDELRRERRRDTARRVVSAGARIVGAVVGGPAAALTGAIGGAGGDSMGSIRQSQEDAREFNMEYLELQQEMQADNRQFTAMSNVLKARHDTARAAISNMRV